MFNFLALRNGLIYKLFIMKTIPLQQFTDRMADLLPELISSIMRDDTSAVSKGRITLPQFWALHHITQHEGLTVNELARRLNRGKSATSLLLRRLEKGKLIRRVRSKDDRRAVHVRLTPKGRTLTEQLIKNRKCGIRRIYAGLTPQERTQHIGMVEKVVRSARASIGLMLLVLLPAAAQGEAVTNRSYTLEESIRIGLDRSLSVANAARGREIAEARRIGAVAEALPSFSGIAQYGRNFPEQVNGMENFAGRETRMVGAEASWRIFSGGRTLAALRASKIYRLLTRDQEQRLRSMQVRDIALAYYQVQLAGERLAALSNSVHQLAEFETETRAKHEAGTVSEFDWLSARVSLANEEPRLMAAANALGIAQEAFRNLTYIDDGRFTLSDPLRYRPVEIPLERAIALGLEKNPELREKAGEVGLRREDVTRRRSDYYPAVDLYADYSYMNPDPYSFFAGDSGWQYQLGTGVRASWTLFDGGSRRAEVAESRLTLLIAEDEYRELQRNIALSIRTAWLRARDAAEVIEATTENVELAHRALEIARSRFNAGLGTNLEVTQANVELSNAQLARSQALYEHMAAVMEMKYAAGLLPEEFDDENK